MDIILFWNNKVPDRYENPEEFKGVESVDVKSFNNNDVLVINHDNGVIRNVELSYLIGWRLVP